MNDKPETPFGIYDIAGIREYCRITYKPPKRPWLGIDDGIPSDKPKDPYSITLFKVIKVPIPIPRNTFRRMTIRGRYQYAAWHWISPTMDFKPDTLESLRNMSGLETISLPEFVSQLTIYCKRISEEHPRLDAWIKVRIALLERKMFKDEGPTKEILSTITSGIYGLAEQSYRQNQDETDAFLLEQMSAVLSNIAAEAKRILSGTGEECSASANLMVSLPLDENTLNGSWPFASNKANAERAKELWRNEFPNADRCLVIVSETELGQHLGFWIPLTQKPLPGACEAFKRGYGVAIFKQYLPSLVDLGFSTELASRWKMDLDTRLEESMFVSIPIRGLGNSKRIFGVVNINIHTARADDWLRAYHREWLDIVERNISPLGAICGSAFIISLADGPKLISGDGARRKLNSGAHESPLLAPPKAATDADNEDVSELRRPT